MKTNLSCRYRKIVIVLSFNFVIALSNANANDLSVYGGITNDSVLRGVSQSIGSPRAQLAVDWNYTNGFFLGSNISRGEASGNLNRQGEIYSYAGYFSSISENKAIEFSLANYQYKGDFFRSWNFWEIQSSYHYNKRTSIKLAYANDYYGRDYENYYLEASWQPKINKDTSALLVLGHTYIPDSIYPAHVNNYQIGVVTSIERFDFNFSYYRADDNAELIHGKDTAGSRFSIEINYAIY